MNGFLRYALLLSACICSFHTTAQVRNIRDSVIYAWKEYFDLSYGPDCNLINGLEYLNIYPNSNGHPFMSENRFYNGRLVIGDRVYQDVKLKYDICNQRLILQYSPFPGGENQIVLNNEFVTEFQLDDRLFRKYTFPETGTRFFQLVASGKTSCIYLWGKDLTVSPNSLDYYYQFSSGKKKAYIIMNNQAYLFRNRRSFLSLFPSRYHPEIKQFIRENEIWVKNGTENSIRNLVRFCNQLAENK